MPPQEERPTRFVADAMLGSLARKLRALGFNTDYYKTGDDSGLLRRAKEGDRTILTSDRALAGRATAGGTRAFLLSGRSDTARLKELAAAARASGFPLTRGPPLCSICGEGLFSVKKRVVAGRVPPSVALRHRLFFQCGSCGQMYWRGGHWKKLMSLARYVGK